MRMTVLTFWISITLNGIHKRSWKVLQNVLKGPGKS